MSKSIIINDVDFSANAIPVAKATTTAAITTVTTSISMTPITGEIASSDFFVIISDTSWLSYALTITSLLKTVCLSLEVTTI